MIDKFNFWCQQVIPLIYDNGLSYYEILCKLKVKINEIIESQNNLITQFEELLKWIDTELESYANKKLEEWLTDGTFENLINKVLFESFNQICINVKTFGATGDGITDDSAAIQEALNSNYTCLYFPNGTYLLKTPLVCNTNKILKGNNPIIKYEKPTTQNDLINVLTINNASFFEINGLKFTTDKNYDDDFLINCIQFINSSNINIHNCALYNASSAIGIDTSNNISIFNNDIYGMFEQTSLAKLYPLNYGYGIVINQSYNAYIINNIIGHNVSRGLYEFIERHSIYISNHTENPTQPHNIMINSNIINNDVFRVEGEPKSGFEYCVSIISGSKIKVINNQINGGVGAFLLRTRGINGGSLQIENNECLNLHKKGVLCVAESSNIYESIRLINNIFAISGNYAMYIDAYNFTSFLSLNNWCKSFNTNQAFSTQAINIRTNTEVGWQKSGTFESENDILIGFNKITQANYLDYLYINSYFNSPILHQNEPFIPYDNTNIDSNKFIFKSSDYYFDFKRNKTSLANNMTYFDRDFLMELTVEDAVGYSIFDSIHTLRCFNDTVNRPNVPYNTKCYQLNGNMIIYYTQHGWQENNINYIEYGTKEQILAIKTPNYGSTPIYNVDDKKPYWYDAYSNVWKDALGNELT